MPSITARLVEKALIHPPDFLSSGVMYETLMGSVAFGVASDTSDIDVYGFCIPPQDEVFPHLTGEIPGFDEPKKRFTQFQQAHILDESTAHPGTIEYDLAIYSIVRYFSLCLECSPNVIDSLFTPDDCVLHLTPVGSMVREARHMFLHKGCWPKFQGFADAQIRKMRSPNPTGKRGQTREQFGFDIKYAYHLVRLISQCEQILKECDMDLRRNRDHLQAIRRGEVPEQEIFRWYAEKEKRLDSLYENCKIRDQPDRGAIRDLLLNCLEHHYGTLTDEIYRTYRCKRDTAGGRDGRLRLPQDGGMSDAR